MIQTQGHGGMMPICYMSPGPYPPGTHGFSIQRQCQLYTAMIFHEAFLSVPTRARPDHKEVHVTRSYLQQMTESSGK